MMLRILLCLCLFMAVPFALADTITIYGNENEELINSMDITVVSCHDDAQNIEHSLVCQNNFQTKILETHQFNDSCTVSFADLHDFGCVDITVQALYDKQGQREKIAKTVRADQVYIEPQQILQTQDWDGGWNTPSDTAYAVWILSQFRQRYHEQIEDAMRWLKQHRDEATKCWATDPFSESCSVYETSRTLAFLSFAGINDTQRIKSDGQFWLESRQNILTNTDGWKLELRPKNDGNCTVIAGGSTLANAEEWNQSKTYSFDITPTYETLYQFKCSMDTTVTLYDHAQQSVFSNTVPSSGYFQFDYKADEKPEDGFSTYRFNPPCWSATTKWQYCNFETTLFSLVPEIREEQHKLAKDWFDEQLRNHEVIGKYVPTQNRVFDSSLYLYAVDQENEDIRRWIVYSQNNDGSWGQGDDKDRVLPTAMAMLALQNQTFSTKNEVLADAYRWFSSRTPLAGWDGTKQDAVTFMVLKDNARPFLKLDKPRVVELSNDQKQLVIVNPTHEDATNVTVTISGSIADRISVSMPSTVQRHHNTSMTMTPNTDQAGFFSGVVSLQDHNNASLLHIPVVLYAGVELQAELISPIYLFEGEGDAQLRVRAVNDNLQCSIQWQGADDLVLQNNIRIDRATTYDIPITAPEGKRTYDVTGMLSCQRSGEEITQHVSMQVITYDDFPFSFTRDSVSISRAEQDRRITLRNHLDEPITVQLRFVEGGSLLQTETGTVELEANSRQRITIQNLIPIETNFTETAVLEASAFGATRTMSIDVDVLYDPYRTQRMISWLIWLVVLVLLGGSGYALFHYRRPIKEFVNTELAVIVPHLPGFIKKRLHMQEEQKDDKPKVDPEFLYYQDVVRIMKSLDKSDYDIAQRLKEEDLSDEQIDNVLAKVKEAEEVESQIKHEDEVKSLLDIVGDTEGDIFKKLRDAGYSEKQIKEAVNELEHTVDDKEKEIKKKLDEMT